MYEWFDRVGFAVDRAVLRREFPTLPSTLRVLDQTPGLECASCLKPVQFDFVCGIDASRRCATCLAPFQSR